MTLTADAKNKITLVILFTVQTFLTIISAHQFITPSIFSLVSLLLFVIFWTEGGKRRILFVLIILHVILNIISISDTHELMTVVVAVVAVGCISIVFGVFPKCLFLLAAYWYISSYVAGLIIMIISLICIALMHVVAGPYVMHVVAAGAVVIAFIYFTFFVEVFGKPENIRLVSPVFWSCICIWFCICISEFQPNIVLYLHNDVIPNTHSFTITDAEIKKLNLSPKATKILEDMSITIDELQKELKATKLLNSQSSTEQKCQQKNAKSMKSLSEELNYFKNKKQTLNKAFEKTKQSLDTETIAHQQCKQHYKASIKSYDQQIEQQRIQCESECMLNNSKINDNEKCFLLNITVYYERESPAVRYEIQQSLDVTSGIWHMYNDIYNSWYVKDKELKEIINYIDSKNIKSEKKPNWFENLNNYKNLIDIQQHRLESVANYGINLFQHELYLRNNITNQSGIHQILNNNLSIIAEQYNHTKNKRIELRQQIISNVNQYEALIYKENDLMKNKIDIQFEVDSCIMELEAFKRALSELETLTDKFMKFSEIHGQNIPKLHEYIENEWQLFESNWINWSADDILSWIKYKMNWLDDESCPSGINLNNILNELNKQEINGKFLKEIDKEDLYQLGFVKFDLRKRIYTFIVELLTKYKEIDASNDQTEVSSVGNKNSKDEDAHFDIPLRFICPITNKIMNDPVIAFDMMSYERDAITQFLKTHKRSPTTNQLLENDVIKLFSNLKLKQEISIFRKTYPRAFANEESHIYLPDK
eukprot:394639_1